MKILGEFRQRAALLETQEALRDLFSISVKQLGYHGFDAFSVRSDSIESPDRHTSLFVCDYGLDVFLPYVSDGWMNMDPSIAKTAQTSSPFDYVAFLREAQSNTSVKWQLGILRLQRVHHAWAVPLNIRNATRGVTVYMRGKGEKTEETFNQTRDEIQLIAGVLMEALVNLQQMGNRSKSSVFGQKIDVRSISRRETDCLHWAARGKTNWEIGQILKISDNTVRFHLKNAFVKLRSNSRSRAVSRALHEGIITL